jgi:hypothetical protein
MLCHICNRRKAKRGCPALGKQICAICCGTKRLVEINCPADCVYLSSARKNPPAVVQRQLEMDREMFIPLLQGLSERQARVFLAFSAVTARHRGEILQRLMDADIAQAAGALAATLETSSRGIIYERQPASLPAARLMSELKTKVDEIVGSGGAALERDAAIALRRIEQGATEMVQARPNTNEFQQALARVLSPQEGAEQGETKAPSSSLIIPDA